jgi:hypothetical protein
MDDQVPVQIWGFKKNSSYFLVSHFPTFSNSIIFNSKMVQGPCAHMVLHDRIYVDFTDLLTVNAKCSPQI